MPPNSRPQIPTFAHYARLQGYRTCLAGKLHAIGPDQLHGFEERLTTDIYPADFGWTPDWRLRRRAHRLVESQHVFGQAGRYRRDHQPARI